MDQVAQKKYHSLFLSDIHLGSKSSQAENLVDFLKNHDAENYYLVGDIVDFWQLRKKTRWPQSHNEILQLLLGKAQNGAKITYIPGNHDEVLRHYCGYDFGGIKIERNTIHNSPDGRRFLVMHGDECDATVFHGNWRAILGDKTYEISIILNSHYNRLRQLLGKPYRSLPTLLKKKLGKTFDYIADFESALIQEAKKRNVEGIICGHIHHAKIDNIEGITYMNTGDWVDDCSAIGETSEGCFEVVHWRKQQDTYHQPVFMNEAVSKSRAGV